jgi:hypothetical protein
MALTVHAACKIDEETRDRLDALLPYLSTEFRDANRSDALRAALLKGLPIVEASFGTTLPPPVRAPKAKRKAVSK